MIPLNTKLENAGINLLTDQATAVGSTLAGMEIRARSSQLVAISRSIVVGTHSCQIAKDFEYAPIKVWEGSLIFNIQVPVQIQTEEELTSDLTLDERATLSGIVGEIIMALSDTAFVSSFMESPVTPAADTRLQGDFHCFSFVFSKPQDTIGSSAGKFALVFALECKFIAQDCRR
jgi:hypothetical protein